MNNVTPIPVRLEAFEGPLDLLLHLIDKNKINIYDIPVSEITDQYLAYVEQMKEENMEVTSEFLVMAATLLDLKSRMLLPREEEEEEEEGDPREELVQRLLDYKLTKYQSEELRDKREEASRNVFREQDLPREVKDYQPPVDYDELLGKTTLQSLTKIFEDVLKRQKNRMDPVRSTFGRIRKEEISIEEKTAQLMEFFRNCKKTSFRALLEGQTSRQGLIVTFLILLDFIKSGMIHIRQSEIFGEIEIFTGALPEGGMGPQETLPSNKAEARALRKAHKKEEAEKRKEQAAERESAVETSSYYKPRVVLSQPRPDSEDPCLQGDAQVITLEQETGDSQSPAEEAEEPSERHFEEAAEEESVSEEELPAGDPEQGSPESADRNRSAQEGDLPEISESTDQNGPGKEEELSETLESTDRNKSPESADRNGTGEDEDISETLESDDQNESGEDEELSESAVYRLIRSKDWETVLDEYMEDEGLAELLEEKETGTEIVSEPEEETEKESEKDREAETVTVKEAEEEKNISVSSREPVEEAWKQAEYPQPSRLYYSPWAVQWKYQSSPQPWKSQKKKPGRQWKRSARSSTMRRAVFRSIAMMMPYSFRPEQNTTNT